MAAKKRKKATSKKKSSGKRLTAAQRKRMKTKNFANQPKAKTAKGKAKPGSYPIPDIEHGRAALRMVAAHGDSATKARVRAKVYKKFPSLRKGKKKK